MTTIKIPRKTSRKGYVWAYVFRHHGKVVKKEGFQTQGEAAEAEGRKRSELRGESYQPQRIFLGELQDRYLTECATVKGLAANTIRQKAFVFKSVMDFLGHDQPAELVTKPTVKEYLKVRAQLSGNCAANRDKKEIKALFNWANAEDILFCRNPGKGIRDFPEDDYQAYNPPRQDILKVKMKAIGDELDFIECIHYLIARRREVQFLRWQDVNFETGWVDLFTRKKGSGLKRMPKPMNDPVRRVLERRHKKSGKAQDVFRFTTKELDVMLPRLCAEAGVQPFGFHAIRHHAATSLLESGCSIKEIQFLLGHERASTTEGYLHIKAGDFHRIVNTLEDKPLRSVTLDSVVVNLGREPVSS
jgi:site-specific recombinase XerD